VSFRGAKNFFYILTILYPLGIFCLLTVFKLPLRLTALWVGFIGIGSFLAISTKKKTAAPGGVFGSPWPVPSCF
jgi:hypothetical protein